MLYSISISLSARSLTLWNGPQAQKTYPVGVGKSSTPTPQGIFFIANKRPGPGGPFGAMWMGLNLPGYGIHGTNNPASIGGMVSKGCIRMHNRDVLELAGIVPVGARVRIGP